MKVQVIGAGVLVAGVAFALWRWDVTTTQLAAARDQVTVLEGRLDEREAELASTGQALQREVERGGRLVEIERGIQGLRQALDTQRREHRVAFEELKQNDEEVRDYLGRGVPEPIGLFYQRPATNDPARYRAGPDMPADTVRSASPGAAENE